MRIALLSDSYTPQVNGVTTVVARIARALVQFDHDVVVVAPRYPDAAETAPNELRVPSAPFPPYPAIRLSLPQFRTVARFLDGFGPDVVHVATEGPLGLTGRRYALRRKVPLVTSYHTNFPQYARHYGAGIAEPLVWKWLRWFHRPARLTQTPGEAVRDELVRREIGRPVVWGRGVDTAHFHPARRSSAWRRWLAGADGRTHPALMRKVGPRRRMHGRPSGCPDSGGQHGSAICVCYKRVTAAPSIGDAQQRVYRYVVTAHLLEETITVHVRRLFTLAAVAIGTTLAPAAQAQAPTIQVQGRIQVQYRLSSGDSSSNYNNSALPQVSNIFEVRRLRIQTNVRFGDNITLVIQPSFEMAALRMRDAYVRVGLNPRFGVTIGQEKSPFQRYELNSSNNLLSIERGLRVLRLSNREGLNDLLTGNGYVSHDLGAFVDYIGPDSKVTVKAGVQSGSRESANDVNNAKSFFGRATATVMTNADNQPVLQVGASFASRDRAICQTLGTPTSTCTAYYADSSKRTTAFGLDAEWGGFRPGFHVFADFATGDNLPIATRKATGRNSGNLDSASAPITTFMGLSLIGAYRINTSGPDTRLIKIFEPTLRVDYLDPDTDSGDNEGLLITPVLNIYFANSVVLRAGFDFYSYKDANTGASRSARELKFSWQANF